jgi:hypothetical protein
MSVPSFFHRYESVPPSLVEADTLNVTDSPSVLEAAAGCVEIVGVAAAGATVNAAADEVVLAVEEPRVFVTTTVYEPASPVTRFAFV